MRGWMGSKRTTNVELGPLSSAEASELVASSTPSGQLPEKVAEHILK